VAVAFSRQFLVYVACCQVHLEDLRLGHFLDAFVILAPCNHDFLIAVPADLAEVVVVEVLRLFGFASVLADPRLLYLHLVEVAFLPVYIFFEYDRDE